MRVFVLAELDWVEVKGMNPIPLFNTKSSRQLLGLPNEYRWYHAGNQREPMAGRDLKLGAVHTMSKLDGRAKSSEGSEASCQQLNGTQREQPFQNQSVAPEFAESASQHGYEQNVF